MKHLLPVLVLLGGCATGGSAGGPSTDQELSVVMSLAVQDPSQLQVGQWVLYSVRREGSPTPFSTKISCVGQEGTGWWLENRTPSGAGFAIWKSLIDKDGKLLELWVGEPGGRASKVYPGMDMHGNPIPPPKIVQPDPSIRVETAKETVAAGGRKFDTTKLTTTTAHQGGQSTTMMTWCSPEVPFSVVHGGTPYGGVVRRIYGRTIMELVATGTGATAELQVVR